MGNIVYSEEELGQSLSALFGGRHRERIVQNFDRYVDSRMADGCREWVGAKNSRGYGHIRLAGRLFAAHRVGFAIHNGTIDDELGVLHTCDNPPCVWGPHLFQGDQRMNMLDASAKGRFKDRRGENGSFVKLTDEKVRQIRLLSASGLGTRRIAPQMGVSRDAIRCVLNGKTWGHVV